MKKIILLSLTLFFSIALLAQKDIENAKKYLETKITKSNEFLIAKDKQQVLNVDVVKSAIIFNKTEDQYNQQSILNCYLLKNGATISAFQSVDDIINTQVFIKALNPQFTLKTPEDASKLRLVFLTLAKDDWGTKRGEVFKKDGTWCFVKKLNFEKLTYYKVSTSDAGKITKVEEITESLDVEYLPDVAKDGDYGKKSEEISASDKELINKELKKVVKEYRFTLKPLLIKGLSGNLKLYEGNLAALNMFSTGRIDCENRAFVLAEQNNKYSIVTSKEELLNNQNFLQALMQSYTIKNEEEAKSFEALIDQIKPAEAKDKKFYKKDNVWCFVRDKFFDDSRGILVLVDNAGKILHIQQFDKITDLDFVRMKTHDPNFKLDYAFKLVEPKDKILKIHHKKGEGYVEISVNADAMNATDKSIVSVIDGEIVDSTSVGNVEAKFTHYISAKQLEDGTKHTLKYLVMPAGCKDPRKALEVIEIKADIVYR